MYFRAILPRVCQSKSPPTAPPFSFSSFTFRFQSPPKLFRINTYEISRKCCNQRTYRSAKSFRFRTYKKQGVGGVMVNQPRSEPRNLTHRRARLLSFMLHKSPASDGEWPSTSVLHKIEPFLYPEFYCSLDPTRIHSFFD